MNVQPLLSATVAFLLALPLAATAHKGPHPPAAGADAAIEPSAQPAVEVVTQFSAALKDGDLTRAGALLAADVLILESGGAERSRDEYLSGHATHDAAFLKGAHVQVKQRTARAMGDLAWVATESELHATKAGKPITLQSSETMVLKRTAQGWRIAHIHWSSRPKKEGTPAPGKTQTSPVSNASDQMPAWLAAEDRAMLSTAQGAGMAKAAEANGWPGPRHVLDLGVQLQLDAGQVSDMQTLMLRMQDSARRTGAAVLAAETALDRELGKAAPDATRVASLTEDVGRLLGQLRSVHLVTHLKAATLLTPAQRNRYRQLRGTTHAHAVAGL